MSGTPDHPAESRRPPGASALPRAESEIQCPSARPDMPGARMLGILEGDPHHPRLAYLKRPEPVRDELLELAEPVSPTRLFRFAAPCAGDACQHFDGSNCRLARRIVERLPRAVSAPPVCALRPACRWWLQEGEDACHRCPMVVTESHGELDGSEELAVAADPATPVLAT